MVNGFLGAALLEHCFDAIDEPVVFVIVLLKHEMARTCILIPPKLPNVKPRYAMSKNMFFIKTNSFLDSYGIDSKSPLKELQSAVIFSKWGLKMVQI